MNSNNLALLLSSDDPQEHEYPQSFDWRRSEDRVRAIQPGLEQLTGRTFVFDNKAQDASFFADLAIQRPGREPFQIDTVIAARFSCFGDLFTIWSHCETEQLPNTLVQSIIEVIESHHFSYVDTAYLDEPYTGDNPIFQGKTWWDRFFDYL